MDALHEFLKWISYNRYTAAGAIVVLIAGLYLGGCEIQTASISSPGEKVTAPELELEIVRGTAALAEAQADIDAAITKHNAAVDAFTATVAAAEADISEQYRVRQEVLSVAGGLITSIAEGTMGMPNMIAGLIGIGSLVFGVTQRADKRRTDKEWLAYKLARAPAK